MKIQQKATIIATTTAFFLAIFKLSVGIFSGSIAILASAIDSLLDMGISIFNFVAVKNSWTDPDDQFNYGRGKIEALAAFLEGIIIAMAGIFIAYESVSRIIYQKPVGEIGIGVVVMIISVIVTGWLVGYLESVAKKNKKYRHCVWCAPLQNGFTLKSRDSRRTHFGCVVWMELYRCDYRYWNRDLYSIFCLWYREKMIFIVAWRVAWWDACRQYFRYFRQS